MDKRKGGAREYHNFLSKTFCLTVPKNFVAEPFIVSIISGTENFRLQRFMSRFFVESFLSHSTEKLLRGTLLCFTKILVSEKIMDKRKGGRKGVSKTSVEKFLSQSAK